MTKKNEEKKRLKLQKIQLRPDQIIKLSQAISSEQLSQILNSEQMKKIADMLQSTKILDNS